MKTLLIAILLIGVMSLPTQSFASHAQQLTDAELDQVKAGDFLEILDRVIDYSMILATTVPEADLVNLNEAYSATVVTNNIFFGTEEGGYEVINSNSAELINDIGNGVNYLDVSGLSQSELQALVNVNSINSASVIQNNLNFNVMSATNINSAVVTNIN